MKRNHAPVSNRATGFYEKLGQLVRFVSNTHTKADDDVTTHLKQTKQIIIKVGNLEKCKANTAANPDGKLTRKLGINPLKFLKLFRLVENAPDQRFVTYSADTA